MTLTEVTKSELGVKTCSVNGALDVFCIISCFSFSHNDFVAVLDLLEGEHQYKFFVDGQWVHDPSEVKML